ncbi:SIR2 family protein, partial [Oceanospirillum sp. HFRX-1_2]
VVHQQEDLSHACSPRIVKLHGTINVNNDLTFTQEDYRTFPVRHAAFVNFARQVFIENELCLLGFFGDDPNFLQWAGWVRDHLSTSARRIYLVGALGLNAAKRKYLESINIAPIDLGELVEEYDDADLKHRKATEIFINALHDMKPKPIWEWVPTYSYNIESFDSWLKELKENREGYPGWIICPEHTRFIMHSSINCNYLSKKFIDNLNVEQRAKLLYEVAWLYNVSFFLSNEWLADEMLKILAINQLAVLSKKQKMEVAVYVLKVSRWHDDNLKLKERAKEFIKDNLRYAPEYEDVIFFHEANEAKLNLNYSKLEQLLPKIIAASPDGKIKKSSLYVALGLFEESKELLSDARRYLIEKYRTDMSSVYILSRLNLVDSLLGLSDRQFVGLNTFSEVSRVRKCDIWQHVESIRKRVQESIEKQEGQRGIELLFEPGSYRDNSEKRSFSNEVHPFIVFHEITNEIGVPIVFDNFGILRDVAVKLVQIEEVDFYNRLYLSVVASNSEKENILEKTFSRIQLAKITNDDCEELIVWIIDAITFWIGKKSSNSRVCATTSLTKIRILVEILARLSVRARPAKAKQIFQLAMGWGHNNLFRDFWLTNSFKHLINYSLSSIPSSEQGEVLLDALRFPLCNEVE